MRAPGPGSSGGEWARLSPATRPLDFMAPWVVDPLVSRFGLIYDISDFTETVTMLRRSGALEQDRSFRMMFRFQRKVNRLASQQRAKLEKYLGDGAFYTTRRALRPGVCRFLQPEWKEPVPDRIPPVSWSSSWPAPS